MIEPITLTMLKVVLGSIWGLVMMVIAYFLLDKITPYDTGKMLKEDNRAVGAVVGNIFIGVGLCIGLIIGLPLF